jgi:hypothetical protein
LPVLLAVLASAMGFRAKPTSTGASTGDTTGDAA